MARRERLSSQDLDARLKFILGLILGTILLCTTLGILYGLLFVTQPVGAQSENDKMFFNVLGSVATFITGTLAGLLIGKSGAQEMMTALEDKKKAEQSNPPTPSTPVVEPTPAPVISEDIPAAAKDPNYN